MFRALIPENVFKILHRLSNDLFAAAGDGVVFAFHHFQGGKRAVGLAGEDAVHQYHHRTLVFRWVKPIGQSDLIGNLAFRATNDCFLRLATR